MRGRPDTVILVYDAEGGLRAKLLDALKKAAGREECALCEVTYSPVGKRSAWRDCERRLGLSVVELHRNEIPPDWGIDSRSLPCVLGRIQTEPPFELLNREQIVSCRGQVSALEAAIVAALDQR